MTTQQTVAGALIDFMGYLTTREKTIEVGGHKAVYDIHAALKEWAGYRGLALDNPDVERWNTALEEGKHKLKAITTCVDKPVIKIVWGDGAVTYAHFSEKAELVHLMGKHEPIERRGFAIPEDVSGVFPKEEWVDVTRLGDYGYKVEQNTKTYEFRHRYNLDGAYWKKGKPA